MCSAMQHRGYLKGVQALLLVLGVLVFFSWRA